MNGTLATWMKLAAVATVIVALIWGLLLKEMGSIADSIASMMGG